MSRSNQTDNEPNPAERFLAWSGKNGTLNYYDKEKEENILVPIPFSFMLLDQLSTVKGWHDPSESGIYANEVRDTRVSPLVVKAFKGGDIAQGLYKDIKNDVKAAGGHFVSSIYIAYRDQADLHIGNLQFKGAALSAWSEFVKENREDIYKKAISIKEFKEGKKGSVVFKTPVFGLVEISESSNKEAAELDKKLQAYLAGYLKRNAPEKPVQEAANSTHKEDDGWGEDTTDHAASEGLPF